MIAARTLKSKEAIDDLAESGESIEDIEIAASNAEKALNSIGLTARTSSGDFKDLEVILGEVAGKWDTLSDATKQYVSEQLAGNNRRSFFIGLMENYERTMELQQLAENSSGQLMEASEKKAESLEGQLNRLQNAWYNLYETMLNSSLVKGGVSTLTKVINAIANSLDKLCIIIPTVVVAWKTFTLALKGYTIFDGIELGIMGVKDALIKLTANLGLTTTAASGATVAMSALQAVCAGLVVGGVAVGIGFLINKLKETKEQMEGVGDNLQELQGNLSQINGVRDLVESYKNANLELTILKEGTDEYIEKQNEIKSIKEQLMQYSSEYKTLLDSETASVEEQCAAMLNLLDYKARQNVKDSLDNLPDQRRANNKVTEFHEDTGQLEELSKEYEEAKKAYDKALVDYANATPEQAEALYTALQNAEKEMTDSKNRFESKRSEAMDDLTFIKNWNETLQTAKEMGVYTELQTLLYSEDLEKALITWMAMDDEATDVGEKTEEAGKQAISLAQTVSDAFKTMTSEEGDMTKAVETISQTFRNGTFEVEDMADALEILKGKFPELLKNAEDFGQAIAILDTKSANESYIEQLNTIEDIKATLEQITEEGFTLEIATELMDSGWLDDYTGRIDDATAVQEHLNNKIAEAQDIANQAYYNMLKDDENFWATKMANSEEWKAHEQQMQNDIIKLTAKALGIQETDFANFINTKGGFRQVDYSNANTMAQAENTLQSNLMSQITGYVAQMTNNKAGYRQTDMSNIVQFLNTQGAKEAQTVQELIDLWAKFYDAKKKTLQAEISDYNKRTQELMKSTNAMVEEEAWLEDGALKHGILNATKQLTDLELSNTAMTNYFAGISAWFNGVSGGVGQNYVGGKGVGGGGLSSSKPSTSTAGSGSGSGSKPSSGSGSSGSGSGSGSGTEKTVEDMELEIDRYYALQDAIENVNKALAKNRALQENVASKAEYKKLVEEEIRLLNDKIKATQNLYNEQIRERNELKSSLKSNGFTFDGNNNITNYANRLKQLQNWANGIANPDQKEAAIAQVKAIKEMVDAYTELEDSTIPSTTEEINSLKNEIISINKEFEENMKLIDALGDRYFDLMRKIAKVDNALALNQAKQDNATERERIELLAQEIDLLLKRQQLVKEQRDEVTKEANEVKNQLISKGVNFDKNGTITNYKALVQSLENKANSLVGDAQDDAVENAQEILDLIDKYVTLTEDTLPNLEVEWENYTGQIQDSKDAIDEIFRSFRDTVVGVQKDIASAYEKYQTERYNKLQEALNKEKELYDKAYEEENFDRNLSEQQRELAEIAEQIAIYSRDTTEAGKARLEQLKQEYEDQQQAINDLIRDKEKSNADERFEEETDKLNKELEDLLAPEKLVSVVNDAIASGMITIGEETMKLDTVMTNWLNDTGDGLYALGDVLQKELIENLQEAQKIIGEINVNGFKAPKANVPTSNQAIQDAINSLKTKSVGDVNFSLTVEGDVTDNNLPKLEKQLGDMEQRIYNTIAKSMR